MTFPRKCAGAIAAVALATGAAAATTPPPPPEWSTIVVPIHSTLAPLLPEIEKSVPRKFADKLLERGFDIRYDIVRDPIALKMIGAGLHTTTTARYALEACRGRACISCGFTGKRPAAAIALHSHLDWDAQWRLRSTTKARPVDFLEPCEITPLRVDADRFIAPVVNAQLRDLTRSIDQEVAKATNLKPEATRIWTALQAPVEIHPRTWLVLEPAEVALGPIRGNGLAVTSTLALRARTRVVVGNRPAVAIKPLPKLSTFNTANSGVRVPLDVLLSYPDATALLDRQFGRKTYDIAGKPLHVDAVHVTPAANGKLQLEAAIRYRGGRLKTYDGVVTLEGTPRFDPATSSIVIPDLDYALDPKKRGRFARIVDRLTHDAVRDRMRSQARFPIAKELEAMRNEVTRGLTRPLSPGVQLRGRADSIQPQSVAATPDAVVIRVVATGAAEVVVTQWK